MHFDKNRLGLTVGSVSALGHFTWVVIVALGFGQRFADFVHNVHFFTDRHELVAFNIVTAALGVIFAFVIGYATGWVFAWIWGKMPGR